MRSTYVAVVATLEAVIESLHNNGLLACVPSVEQKHNLTGLKTAMEKQ
jgi:hypothetical protein